MKLKTITVLQPDRAATFAAIVAAFRAEGYLISAEQARLLYERYLEWSSGIPRDDPGIFANMPLSRVPVTVAAFWRFKFCEPGPEIEVPDIPKENL